MVAIVFGIQGVGKSSVVNGVLKNNSSFSKLWWGKDTLELAMREGLAKDIDDVRNLSVEKQRGLQKKIGLQYEKLIKENSDKNYIIETHAALKTPQGFFPGFSPEIIAQLKPEVLFVIESHAIDIYHRRILDESRRRDHDKTVREIQLNLDATRWYASTMSVISGASLLMVENVEDNLHIAVDKILDVLQKYQEAQ